MVFESIVAYFLDKYLSSYLDNFDSSKLKIGIWNGDVVLENLKIKPNALDEFDLPVRIVVGHLKQLKLKIPWKSLYTESVKVTIDGLTILIAPKASVKYDAERDKLERIESKLNEVKKIVETESQKNASSKTKEAEKAAAAAKQDTFTERIQMQVIRNLELQIKNIHIRYEDDFSKPEFPFSAGFMLDTIEIRTVDSNWQPTYLKEDSVENSNYINKIASLISFAIYCNSNDLLLNQQPTEQIINKLQRMVKNDPNVNYILRPLSLRAKTKLNMKPKLDNYKNPMFDVMIELDSVGLCLNRLQYFDVIDTLNTVNFMRVNSKYKKYRVETSQLLKLESKSKQLWNFAYKAITEDQIRPKREQYKWEHIKLIASSRRDYVNLLKKKLKSVKLTNQEMALEKKCEEVLDVFNLVLARKQADVEIARVAAQEKKPSSSWLSWLSGNTTSQEDKQKLSEAESLSKEEKEKLYDAIGYTEEADYSAYPREYINIKLKFLLTKFEVNLIDRRQVNAQNELAKFVEKNLLHLSVDNMELSLYHYPVVSGLKVCSSIRSISLTGSGADSTTSDSSAVRPMLIEPDIKDQVFIELTLELNPLDRLCNKRFHMSSKSLKIVYHAHSINNIVYFFRAPEKIGRVKIKNSAINTMKQVRERSLMFMKNNLSNIEFMDVNIDIQPSYLIIPYGGEYSEVAKSICINFGSLSLKSEPKSDSKPAVSASETKKQPKAEANDDDEEEYLSATDNEEEFIANSSNQDIIQASYWKYKIFLKQIQIVLINNMDELGKLRRFEQADELKSICERCYILAPLDLYLNIHQCVYTDDAKLPAWKVFGNLPIIQLDLSEHNLQQSIAIAVSIPLPKRDDSSAQGALSPADMSLLDDLDEGLDPSTSKLDERNFLDELNKLNRDKSVDSVSSADSTIQQTVDVELSFEINELQVKLKEDEPENFDFILLKVASFGTSITLKSYDSEINVYLKQVSCEYGLFNDTDGEKLYLFKSCNRNESRSMDLINIDIVSTGLDSPTLKTLHGNSLTTINVDLCLVDVVVNLIALRNMFKFADKFDRYLNSAKYDKYQSDVKSLDKPNTSSNNNQPLLGDGQIMALLKSGSPTTRKFLIDPDVIEYKLNARFDGIRARLGTKTKRYFQIEVKNFQLNIENKLTHMNLDMTLNSISILDLDSAHSSYGRILSLKEDSQDLIRVNVRLVTPPRSSLAGQTIISNRYRKEKFYFRNYLDESFFDICVKANISKVKVIFLFRQVNTLLALLKLLDAKKQMPVKQLADEGAKAKQPAVDEFEFLTRIKLDVTINAPLIIVPQNAHSQNALLLDCGVVTIATSLNVLKNYYEQTQVADNKSLIYRCKLPPVVEVQKITLSNMEISKITLTEKELSIDNQLFLVDCSELKLTIKRNLQPQVFKTIEPLNVEVIYGGLLVSIARSDYSFLLELLANLDDKTADEDPDLPKLESADKKKASSSESTAALPVAIANITVRVFIESIRMYLFKDDCELHMSDEGRMQRHNESAFSKMEIKNLQMELNLFDDTDDVKNSMKVFLLLDNIILDDTRRDLHGKKAIRLVERYVNNTRRASTSSMFTVTYENKLVRDDDNNDQFVAEKHVNGVMSCLRLCVNVDYLLMLYEFFIESLPKSSSSPSLSKSATGERFEDLSASMTSMSTSFAPDLDSPSDLAKSNQKLYCDFRIENPQFILYENQLELKRSNSLIMDGIFLFKFNIDNERIKLHTVLSDFMIRLKSVSKKRVLKQNKHIILSPTTISFSGTIENVKSESKPHQSFILDVQDINLNASPQMLSTSLKMMNTIQSSLDRKFKKPQSADGDDERREETHLSLESFFKTVDFSSDEFWFTQGKKEPPVKERPSTASLASIDSSFSQSTPDAPRSLIREEMIIRASKIFVKLEAGLSNQIPLIGLSISCMGEVANWSNKLTLALTTTLEMAYFNESKSIWEPVIEPIEQKNDKYTPYTLIIEMITHESKREKKQKRAKSGIEQHMNNLVPIRTFNLQSNNALQLVVTKTFLSMLDTILKTLKLNDANATSTGSSAPLADYEQYELEEEQLMEKFRNRFNHENDEATVKDDDRSPSLEDFDEGNELGAGASDQSADENPSFNFLIKNDLGLDLELEAMSGFKFQNLDFIDSKRDRSININKIELKNNVMCPIVLTSNYSNPYKSITLSNNNDQISEKKSIRFKLKVIDSEWDPINISMNHLTLNGYYVNEKGAKGPSESLIVCETVTNLDKRRIYLRSQIQVINMMDMSVDITYPVSYITKTDKSSYSHTDWKDTTIKPGKKWPLPVDSLAESFNSFIRIAPAHERTGTVYQKQIVNWKTDTHKLVDFAGHVFIQILIEKEPLNILNQSMHRIDFVYNIVLLPTVTFYNYLPFKIKYKVDNGSAESNKNPERKELEPGESAKLTHAKIGASSLLLEMANYANSTWYASQAIEFFNEAKASERGVAALIRNEETQMIEFRSRDAKIITLQYTVVKENNCISFSLYAPYWILNQTKLKLEYKFKGYDDEINEIDNSHADSPIFFKINSRVFNVKKKEILFRVKENNQQDTEWSNSFLIDTAGNKGTISSASRSKDRTRAKNYEMGVDIQLSQTGLTKVIKLTPYYLIINNTDYLLEIKEYSAELPSTAAGELIESKKIVPFWSCGVSVQNNPNNVSKKSMKVRLMSSKEDADSNIPFSQPFWYNIKHSTVLKLANNPYAEVLCVECIPSEEIIRIVFKPYSYGLAPVLILNYLDVNLPVIVAQKEENNDDVVIAPKKYYTKTWKNPIGKRELVWSCGETKNSAYDLDTMQSVHKFKISNTSEGYMLSFLDGMQRVLMFVDKLDNLNDEVVGFKEIKGDEFVLNLESLGLSLVDDKNQLEILYMSITSSSISWGEKSMGKYNVFKAFTNYKIEKLEENYQKYLEGGGGTGGSSKIMALDELDDVDFDRMVLYVGKKEITIERHYAPSVYINFFSSPNQTTLHMMINKIQIDNQLYDAIFPVLFYKVNPPKSVTTSSINKPIVEMSLIQSYCQRTKTTEIKYFKTLVQEFFVKLDIVFLNAIMDFLNDDSQTNKKYIKDSNTLFKEIDDIGKSFTDMFESLDEFNIKNEKVFFDLCHISPIKMHLSFSLAGADAFKNANILLNNPFFKSIGLVLTDMQDVVFKLGYFEVTNSVYTWQELSKEAVNHYQTQVIKQAYILVFGLDVLGNPYGLIRGLYEGIESLFYEPYAGIVQGPGEFAQGVALGLKNFLGSTLGSAAGAFSKITGTLGKGLATLSLDKEYQKSRQKTTDNFLKNVGQNLVMGVVSGVTGIVEKPIEGAKTAGFGGFLGGFGKGLIGVVTKPTAGIVDFTSQSLEEIRKVAVQEESVERVRAPRCIYQDGIIRPYRKKEAQIDLILKGLDDKLYINDRLIASLDVDSDSRTILIGTNNHILLVEEHTMFTRWKSEWVYELDQLVCKPVVAINYIKFTFKNREKKLFSKDSNVEKQVPFRHEIEAKKFVSKMLQVMTETNLP